MVLSCIDLESSPQHDIIISAVYDTVDLENQVNIK